MELFHFLTRARDNFRRNRISTRSVGNLFITNFFTFWLKPYSICPSSTKSKSGSPLLLGLVEGSTSGTSGVLGSERRMRSSNVLPSSAGQ